MQVTSRQTSWSSLSLMQLHSLRHRIVVSCKVLWLMSKGQARPCSSWQVTQVRWALLTWMLKEISSSSMTQNSDHLSWCQLKLTMQKAHWPKVPSLSLASMSWHISRTSKIDPQIFTWAPIKLKMAVVERKISQFQMTIWPFTYLWTRIRLITITVSSSCKQATRCLLRISIRSCSIDLRGRVVYLVSFLHSAGVLQRHPQMKSRIHTLHGISILREARSSTNTVSVI